VWDLIEARLGDLSAEERDLLDVGSVLGFEFDPALVAAVLKRERVTVLQDLARVHRRSGTVVAHGRSYRFDHHQIQEVVYAELSDGLREEYHTRVADAFFARVEDGPSGEENVFLARHHLRGRRPEAAIEHLLPALDHLARTYRNDELIELADRALDLPDLLTGAERVEALGKKADRHGFRGEPERQRSALIRALELAEALGDSRLRAIVCAALGGHFTDVSDWGSSKERYEQSLSLAREAGDDRLQIQAMVGVGAVLLRSSRHEEARDQLERAIAHSSRLGARDQECSANVNLGSVLSHLGRGNEAVHRLRRGLDIAREIGDRSAEVTASQNLGSILWSLGRYEEAWAQLHEALALAREIGRRRTQGCLGRFEEACGYQGQAIALARETGNRLLEARATGNLGNMLRRLGRYGEARTHHERRLALVRELGIPLSEGIGLACLALVEAVLGLTDLAARTSDEAIRVLRKIGAPSFEGKALAGRGAIHEQVGDLVPARHCFEKALALCRESSDRAGVSEILLEIGELEIREGNEENAVAHLEEAASIAGDLGDPRLVLRVAVARAGLPGGRVESALAAVENHEEGAWLEDRMHVRFQLWESVRDRTHLEEAHRLLCYALFHAPEEFRETMIANVPLHRDIMAAWAECGGEAV
ncbi:MAG: tetratricopeptide repeat protein, partial [Planctomycetota bacterium]